MTKGKQLFKRRSEMLREKALGVELSEIVPRFSKEYEVSEKAIYQDWERRAKWADEVVEIDDPRAFVAELHDILNWVKRRAVLEVLTAKLESTRLGAFKTLLDVVKTHFDIVQATGKVQVMPSQITQSITLRWENGADLNSEV